MIAVILYALGSVMSVAITSQDHPKIVFADIVISLFWPLLVIAGIILGIVEVVLN